MRLDPMDVLLGPYHAFNALADAVFLAVHRLFALYGTPVVFVAAMAEATVEISSFRAPKALFGGAKGGDAKAATEIDDGRQTMRKLFVDSKLVQEADFNRCWVTPDTADTGQVQDSFIQILADRNLVPVDKSLRVLSVKARVAFLPVDRYDIDIEWVRSFPRKVCQRWCEIGRAHV